MTRPNIKCKQEKLTNVVPPFFLYLCPFATKYNPKIGHCAIHGQFLKASFYGEIV